MLPPPWSLRTAPSTTASQMAAAVQNDILGLSPSAAVSTANGFQHDLKRVCDIAHAHGYALCRHGPRLRLDCPSSPAPPASTSRLAFPQVADGRFSAWASPTARKEVQDIPPALQGPLAQVGGRFITHVYPYDDPAPTDATHGYDPGANGLAPALGNTFWTGAVHLNHSLGLIEAPGRPCHPGLPPAPGRACRRELRRRGGERPWSSTSLCARRFCSPPSR